MSGAISFQRKAATEQACPWDPIDSNLKGQDLNECAKTTRLPCIKSYILIMEKNNVGNLYMKILFCFYHSVNYYNFLHLQPL